MGAVLLLAFKVIPVYNEYANVRRTIQSLATEGGRGEYEIRREFNLRAPVADITSIRGEQLVVIALPQNVSIRAKYRREVPLFSNISLAFDFDTQAGQIPQS